MGKLRQSLRRIPFWAFLVVLLVVSVKTISLINNYRLPETCETGTIRNRMYIIDYVMPGGPIDNAGIHLGDTVISCNSYPITEWLSGYHKQRAGDTLILEIVRNKQQIGIPVVTTSKISLAPGFYWSFYLIMILASVTSLFLLYRKPHEKTVEIFFIYIQLVIISSIGGYNEIPDWFVIIAAVIFKFSTCLMGPAIIHFHLLFPRPVKFLDRYKAIPLVFYFLGILVAVYYSAEHFYTPGSDSALNVIFTKKDLIGLHWVTWTFLLALTIVIYQYMSTKNTLTRNQLLIVFTGSCFGFITPVVMTFFFNEISILWSKYPNLIAISQGTGSFILVCSIVIAIFRYRIWDIEVFIRRAMLYLGATMVIILSYLFLLYLVDLFTIRETRITRFVILAVSVFIFLALRDWFQRILQKIFFRETYDPTTVVSRFEEKLAGIYRADELKSNIVQGMDEIFHFSTFVLLIKKHELIYEPVYAAGLDHQQLEGEYRITRELENRLHKQKVFSPGEMEQFPAFLEPTHAELVVPFLKDEQPYGFFLCGPKKSEKAYSIQDIRLLMLIATRVISLFHTASLYQKDLDRQLMLERERVRISQDMHDDVGASLTRISMMSDLVKNRTDVGGGAREWLGKISETSRGLMEEMNQIIWALNPRNDNLEGLITYVRRFAFEYLEPAAVSCVFDLPGELPNQSLSVEVRRNIYLVVREALHNVVKHAGATKVIITLTSLPGRQDGFSPSPSGEGAGGRGVRLSIRDNGKGFDQDNLEFPGNGLINMKKRMHDIGGEFFIHSHPGEGTEIELEITQKGDTIS